MNSSSLMNSMAIMFLAAAIITSVFGNVAQNRRITELEQRVEKLERTEK